MPEPVVSLLRHPDYDPPAVEDALRRLLDPLGGIEAFVQPGARVLLKPNLVSGYPPDAAVTTHPAVVRGVARLVQEAGGEVRIGDSPGIGSAAAVAKTCGLLPVCEALGVDLVEFTPQDTFEESRVFKKLTLAKELLDADVVINLPKLKTHCQMCMTMAVKNLFGAVVGPEKFQWHYRAGRDKLLFATMLYEICVAVRPALSIMDGIVGADHNGPTHGKPNPLGILAAGADPSAVDAVLLDCLGIAREELWTLQAARRCGDTAWMTARVAGAAPESLRPASWTPAETHTLGMVGPMWLRNLPAFGRWIRNRITATPHVIPRACKRCGICVRVCPAQVMEMTASGITVNARECIRCYCCHELCPHDAIGLKTGWLARWFGGTSSQKTTT